MATDIEDFSGRHRNDAIRASLRTGLRQRLASALADSGIDEGQYDVHTTGDGWLVTIDPVVGKPRILGSVVDRLATALNRQYRQADSARQLRVRMVVHAGDLLVDGNGDLIGAELNVTFRLLDAQKLRNLLKRASGPLVVCVSDAVYQQVVAQQHEGLDPAAFEPVWLVCKRTRGLGWVRAPGEPGLASRTGLLRDQRRRTN